MRLHKALRNCGMMARSARPQPGSSTSCATRAAWQAASCKTSIAREARRTVRQRCVFISAESGRMFRSIRAICPRAGDCKCNSPLGFHLEPNHDPPEPVLQLALRLVNQAPPGRHRRGVGLSDQGLLWVQLARRHPPQQARREVRTLGYVRRLACVAGRALVWQGDLSSRPISIGRTWNH